MVQNPDTLFSNLLPFLDHFTPWQLIVSTLTAVYAMRNADKLIGLGGEFSRPIRKLHEVQLSSPTAPEPLARLVCSSHLFLPLLVCNYFMQYAPSYYRATWINTGLDAGFATAMHIRRKWLRDICSILFSVYYIIFANEADEKVRWSSCPCFPR